MIPICHSERHPECHSERRAKNLLASGLLATILLAACGGSAAPASPTASSAAPVASAAKPAASAAASASAKPAASGAASAAAKPGLRKIHYGTTGAGFNPFIALDQGYFAEQGLDLDLVRFDSAVNMVAPLGAGQLDAGNGAIGAGLWNAVARGVNVKVVADGGHTENGFPQQEIVVRKTLVDSGKVKSVADLKGLKLGMSVRGSSIEYAIFKMLQKGGLTMKDIEPVEMPPTEFAIAMTNGKVDAAAAIQPSLTQLLTEGIAAHLIYDYEAVPDNQSLAVLYSPQMAESDMALPFMTAYLKGIRIYDDAFQKRLPEARDKAYAAGSKYGPLRDRAVFEKYTSFFLVDPDGKLRLQSLNDQQEYFLSTGVQTSKLDFSKVVDTRFAEQAATKLGPYK